MSHKDEIIAPKLKIWLEYRSKLTSAMTDIEIKKEVEQFLQTPSYQIPNVQRKIILDKIYNIADGKYEEWMMVKLKNAFSFNRTEIYDCVKSLIDKNKEKLNDKKSNAACAQKRHCSSSVSFNNNNISKVENTCIKEEQKRNILKNKENCPPLNNSFTLIAKNNLEEISNDVNGTEIGAKIMISENEANLTQDSNIPLNKFKPITNRTRKGKHKEY